MEGWSILQTLSVAERRSVMRVAVRHAYGSGESVYVEGDRGDSLHLITSGHVAVRNDTALGNQVTLTILGPRETFGEQALISPDSLRTATVVALGSVVTMAINRRDFASLRARYPGVNAVLVEALAAQVRRLSALLLEAHFMPADQRVMRRLQHLAGTFDSDEGCTIPLTQEDLASLAGTTRSTANRTLRHLDSTGVIVLRRGRINVVDVDALQAVTD